MTRPVVLVTYAPSGEQRRVLAEMLGDVADVRYWPDAPEASRDALLREAKAVLSFYPFDDLGMDGMAKLGSCDLLQCLTAGTDYLPLKRRPVRMPVACNAGAYAKPMAEHVLAMALGAAKRLVGENAAMRAGEFNQFKPTKRIAGLTCGILGYGRAGREVARLMRPLGARVLAVNRSGETGDPVAFAGTLDDLGQVLAASDILVITLSLTPATEGLLGEKELASMKPDAILVNVARGEIIDQGALCRHLAANPGFTACLEAWWVEPIRHGRFELEHPLLELPNVIASPHNSAVTEGTAEEALRGAARNVRRLLEGGEPLHLVAESDMLN